jgi:O-methyltransferase
MNRHLKTLARRVLPDPVLSRLLRYRHRVSDHDEVAAWRFKHEFFWNAFKALDFNCIDGDYVEFGCHGGMTFRLAFDQIRQRNIKRHMWAFDSFEGLPERTHQLDNHPRWKKGDMSTGVENFHQICRVHGISHDAYTAVKGFYAMTLIETKSLKHPSNIALAYVDCDMYSSTKLVLQFLKPLLKHGMILAFDDYFCWSADHISGERQALLEMLDQDDSWNLVRYKDFGWTGVSFVVEQGKVARPSL